MKGFLIFLAIAFPVAVASPYFWSLVRMEWGAERIGYHYKDGVTQWAMLGPKAPWPRWAAVPDGARLTVRASYEPAPGHPAIGYADIDGKESPRELTDRYVGQLKAAGWQVRVGRFDASSPDIPPKPIHWCIVQASKGARVTQMSVEIGDPETVGRMHWAEGTLPFPAGATDKPCWAA